LVHDVHFFYQPGECIEGLHTDGIAQALYSTHVGRPQLVCKKLFFRYVLDRDAKLWISKEMSDSECVQEGSHRRENDGVAGKKVRVLVLDRLESGRPTKKSARHRGQPIWTRSQTIAAVAINYDTVPRRLGGASTAAIR